MPLVLNDKLADAAIDNISAYIVTTASAKLNMPFEKTVNAFLQSKTAALLGDKSTGYYWDSMPELLDMFVAEISGSK